MLCRTTRTASVFSLPEYLQALSIQKKASLLYVAASNGCIVPVLVHRPRNAMGRFGMRFVEIPGPPIMKIGRESIPYERNRALFEVIGELNRKLKPVSIELTKKPWDPFIDRQELGGWIIHRTGDYMVDLRRHIHIIFSSFEKRQRYSIRKASGLKDDALARSSWIDDARYILEDGSSPASSIPFLKLWHYTQNKMQCQRGVIRSRITGGSLSLTTLREGLKELLKSDLARIFTIRSREGNPLSSAIVFLSPPYLKNRIAYWSAGTNAPNALKNNTSTLLQWRIMQWLKENGVEKYYLGGIELGNPSHGPTLFKRGFGGDTVYGFSARKLISPWKELVMLGTGIGRMVGW